MKECNITLYTKRNHQQMQKYSWQCFGSAIMDTACTGTVCGQEWLDNYMTVSGKKKVKSMWKTAIQSHRPFMLGDGKMVYSVKKDKIPANIGNTRCNIETEVVPVNIPLLLSKTSLKKADSSGHRTWQCSDVQSTCQTAHYQLKTLLCEHGGQWG